MQKQSVSLGKEQMYAVFSSVAKMDLNAQKELSGKRQLQNVEPQSQ